MLVSCKNSCYWKYDQWTSDAQGEACLYDHGASWPYPPVVPECCGVMLHSLESQLCNQTGASYCSHVRVLQRLLHTHLPCCRSMVLPEWGTGSYEYELCAGRRGCLIWSLATLPYLGLSMNWWRLLTPLCWEPTCLSCLVQALVETCLLWRMKLKFLMPCPVTIISACSWCLNAAVMKMVGLPYKQSLWWEIKSHNLTPASLLPWCLPMRNTDLAKG